MRARHWALLIASLHGLACDDDGLSMVAGTDADAGPTAPDAFALDLGTPDLGELDAHEPQDAVAYPDAEPPADAFAPDACSDRTETAQLQVATAAHVFSGVIDGATSDGAWVITEPNGGEVRGTVPTDRNGVYSVELPLFCGTQTVTSRWDVGGCMHRIVTEVERTDCGAQDIRVTLTWDDLGLDWELHLIRPGGRINDPATDCTWNTCIHTRPDWGVIGDSSDDPEKDLDNTGHYGPENISLSGPTNGTYTIMVEHWGLGDPASSGEATINIGGGATTAIPIMNLAPQHVRYVAQIEWPSGTVTPLSTVFDCSASWAGGCQAAIP